MNDNQRRSCVVCNKKVDKEKLHRFVLINNEIVVDIKHKVFSYGYYFCKNDENCYLNIHKFLKKKKRLRVLNVN